MKFVIGCLMYIGYVICIIAAGMFAWNWAEPNNFWGVLFFLFVWGIAARIASFVWQVICVFLTNLFNE